MRTNTGKENYMRLIREDLLLYAVTDKRWLDGETLYSQVEKALKGGVTFVQLREKQLDEERFLEEALEIGRLCRSYGVPFVINDNVAIAAKSDADGVHVGQDDMDVGSVRALLGPDKIIGVSVHTVEEALAAEAGGADYLGTGSAFSTGTKKDARLLPDGMLHDICGAVKIPVAIGGIEKDNMHKLQGNGLSGIAVVHAIFGQPDITGSCRELKEQVKRIVWEV